jgi:hypothetical protein
MCPLICITAFIAFFIIKRDKSQKITACSFFKQMGGNFVSASDFYMSEKIPILGVFGQIFTFLALTYFIVIVSNEVSQIKSMYMNSPTLSQIGQDSIREGYKICAESDL